MKKKYVKVGQTVRITVGFSEAAIHTRIAGTSQLVKIVSQYMGQVVDVTSREIGGQYLLGELGFYSDPDGIYYLIDEPKKM